MSAEALTQTRTLIKELSIEERLQILDEILQGLPEKDSLKRAEIEGLWAGKFPPDMDLDAVLQEIRNRFWEDMPEGE